MKKMDIIAGFVFLGMAGYPIYRIVKLTEEGSEIPITLPFTVIFMVVLAIFYFALAHYQGKMERKKMIELTSCYNILKGMYSDIKTGKASNKDSTEKHFLSGSYEFGGITYSILTGGYSNEAKEKAEEMHNELLMDSAKLLNKKLFSDRNRNN